jgi:hypothetical protein
MRSIVRRSLAGPLPSMHRKAATFAERHRCMHPVAARHTVVCSYAFVAAAHVGTGSVYMCAAHPARSSPRLGAHPPRAHSPRLGAHPPRAHSGRSAASRCRTRVAQSGSRLPCCALPTLRRRRARSKRRKAQPGACRGHAVPRLHRRAASGHNAIIIIIIIIIIIVNNYRAASSHSAIILQRGGGGGGTGWRGGRFGMHISVSKERSEWRLLIGAPT